MDNSPNKTPPGNERRNEESCEAQSRVIVVPVVVEPVPVQDNLTTVLDEVRDVEVTIAVLHECIRCRLYHRPSNTLRVESYSASQMREYLIPSIFIF